MKSLFVPLVMALLLALPARPADAGTKPEVGVCFLMNEPHYINELQEADRLDLEQRVAGTLAERLSERIAFLDAVPLLRDGCVREAGDPLLLTVELNQDAENAEGSIYDVVFHLSLDGAEEATEIDGARRIQWLFRKKGNVFDVEYAVPAFHSLIAEALDRGDYDHLVRALLSRMPIPAKAELFKSSGPLGTVGWELVEHSHDDLCMSAKSELAIVTRFGADPDSDEAVVYTKVTKRGGSEWRSRTIRGKVTSEGNEEEVREALKLLTNDEVEALGVHVVKYVLLRPCGSAAPQDSGL